MASQVLLSSGAPVDGVTTKVGARIAELREELSNLLDIPSGGIEIMVGGAILEDHHEVPDCFVNVTLSSYPWIGEESIIQDLGGNMFIVGGDPKKGSPINALCDLGFSQEQIYFEVEVLEGVGAWVGICTKQGFQPGWKCKGLFFGGPGNLSNGGGGLRTGIGEKVKKGSIIGCSIDLSEAGTVSVDFWQDDKYLGEAFRGCPREPEALVYPVVRAQAKGDSFKVAFRRRARIPDEAPKGPLPHPAEGKWKLDLLTVEGVDRIDPNSLKGMGKGGKGKGVTLAVAPISMAAPPDPSTFRISVKVGNSINGTVTVTPTADGERVAIGALMGTKMMIMGPMAALENRILELLPRITAWSVTDAGTTLRLSGSVPHEQGGPLRNLEIVFVPDDSKPDPVSDDALMPRMLP